MVALIIIMMMMVMVMMMMMVIMVIMVNLMMMLMMMTRKGQFGFYRQRSRSLDQGTPNNLVMVIIKINTIIIIKNN